MYFDVSVVVLSFGFLFGYHIFHQFIVTLNITIKVELGIFPCAVIKLISTDGCWFTGMSSIDISVVNGGA